MDRARLKKWAEQRVPARARAEAAVVCTERGSTTVITEERAPWDGVGEWTSRKVARLRHTDEGVAPGRGGPSRPLVSGDHLPGVPFVDEALAVLGDPRHTFWG